MSLDAKLKARIERAFRVVDDRDTAGPRLVDDAHRLWRRILKFAQLNLVADGLQLDALELAGSCPPWGPCPRYP